MVEENALIFELLARVRRGDAAAIKKLYTLCSIVYPHVLRMGADRALARDVHWDTVTAIWKGAAEFRGESKFTTWVIAIARNLAFSALRKKGRDPLRGTEADPEPSSDDDEASAGAVPAVDAEADPFHAVARRQQREGVLCCIGKLSPKLGECLLLVYYGEMTQAEVSALLGININTVKTRIRDAQQRIQGCLGRLLGGGVT